MNIICYSFPLWMKKQMEIMVAMPTAYSSRACPSRADDNPHCPLAAGWEAARVCRTSVGWSCRARPTIWSGWPPARWVCRWRLGSLLIANTAKRHNFDLRRQAPGSTCTEGASGGPGWCCPACPDDVWCGDVARSQPTWRYAATRRPTCPACLGWSSPRARTSL